MSQGETFRTDLLIFFTIILAFFNFLYACLHLGRFRSSQPETAIGKIEAVD